jgi:hypothetical protein
MESLNPTTATTGVPETFEMKLNITDGAGVVHELEITKVEGQQPLIHMFGNNIKLVSRLRMALDIVERAEGALI